jgi:hypothetical protein
MGSGLADRGDRITGHRRTGMAAARVGGDHRAFRAGDSFWAVGNVSASVEERDMTVWTGWSGRGMKSDDE